MPNIIKHNEIIELKKLRKDGSLDSKTRNQVSSILADGNIVVLPVDSIYGVAGIMNEKNKQLISSLTGTHENDIVRFISSFKMLDKIVDIDKLEFDFLHRIWPGEVTVYLQTRENTRNSIPVGFPKSKYMIEIIDGVGVPLYYSIIRDDRGHHVYSKNVIVNTYRKSIACIVIINEFCKDHTEPSIVDISHGDIRVITEGRISSEEIKSLYFLGKDDIQ